MGVYTSPQALAAAQIQRAQRVQRSLKITQDTLAGEVKAEAYALVSGNIDSATLRYLGHPFKRRDAWEQHGSGAAKPVKEGVSVVIQLLPINVQTDRLRRSLRMFARQSGNRRSYIIQFTDPKAKYILSPTGTKYMIPRGFWEALTRFARINQGARYANALRSAERG